MAKASNAALHDDEDVMVRRRKRFDSWAKIERRKRASQGMMYPNSPKPPMHSAMAHPRSVATKD